MPIHTHPVQPRIATYGRVAPVCCRLITGQMVAKQQPLQLDYVVTELVHRHSKPSTQATLLPMHAVEHCNISVTQCHTLMYHITLLIADMQLTLSSSCASVATVAVIIWHTVLTCVVM